MAWNIELSPEARKDLAKVGVVEAKRVLKFLHERLRLLENPRSIGESMKGSRFAGLWRYRSGDYRILCEIQDDKINILVVLVGHRREVYK
jgi:mRNA interferase RelE/StbE